MSVLDSNFGNFDGVRETPKTQEPWTQQAFAEIFSDRRYFLNEKVSKDPSWLSNIVLEDSSQQSAAPEGPQAVPRVGNPVPKNDAAPKGPPISRGEGSYDYGRAGTPLRPAEPMKVVSENPHPRTAPALENGEFPVSPRRAGVAGALGEVPTNPKAEQAGQQPYKKPFSEMSNEEKDRVLAAVAQAAKNNDGQVKHPDGPIQIGGPRAGEQPAEQPTETPAEQPTETPAEQPAETPAEQPTETPAEQPTETPAEQPAETPVEQPAEPTETTGRGSGSNGVIGDGGSIYNEPITWEEYQRHQAALNKAFEQSGMTHTTSLPGGPQFAHAVGWDGTEPSTPSSPVEPPHEQPKPVQPYGYEHGGVRPESMNGMGSYEPNHQTIYQPEGYERGWFNNGI